MPGQIPINSTNKMDFKTVTPSKDAISVGETTLTNYSEEMLHNPHFWHKFIIEDTHYLKRNAVLRILLAHIQPLDLIPLSYTEDDKSACFFARNCGQAIKKLCNDRLTVLNPLNTNKPFKLKLVLKYSTVEKVKVDLSKNVMKVLLKRLSKSGELNLAKFSEDPDLSEFFQLSQPRLLAFVLNAARSLKLRALNLGHNEIKGLEALRIVTGQNLVSVDLRHNLINDLDELKHLENFEITELWLEGNPLCLLYDEYNYVQQVLKYCPKIEKIDGFLLRQNGIPSFRRNFLCNLSAYNIIDQFLDYYFTTYDIKHFAQLEALYHEEAVFSMTAQFDKSPETQNARNLPYLPKNGSTNLCIGHKEILRLFNKLPRSEHDPYSFTVDVLHDSGKCVIVVVAGVFREVPETERLLGFNRCFVIERRGGNYRIANEQFYVCSALTSQHLTAFRKSNVLQQIKSTTQQTQMINTFAMITSLTIEFAKMFLEECQYKLKHALMLFVDLYRSDKIPPQGFRN